MLGKDADSPLEIFFSYAHKDEKLMNRVRLQLVAFERAGRILKWHDRMIPLSSDWREQIDERLNSADIILLFMSPDFIESNYCFEIEGRRALERHEAGDARVIPVILRPCPWEETPFGRIQGLPSKPITQWSNRDEVCLKVARGIMEVVDSLGASEDLPVEDTTPKRRAAHQRIKRSSRDASTADAPASQWSSRDTNRVIAATTACICISALTACAIALLFSGVTAERPVEPILAALTRGSAVVALAAFCYIPFKMLRIAMEAGGTK